MPWFEPAILSLKILVLYQLSQKGLAKLIDIACCCFGSYTCVTVQLLVFSYPAHSNIYSVRKSGQLIIVYAFLNHSSSVTSPDTPLILWAVPCESLVVHWRASALPLCNVRAFSCCLFEGTLSCIMYLYPEKGLGTVSRIFVLLFIKGGHY